MSKDNTILHIAPTPFFSDRGCHIRIAGIVRSLEKLGFDNSVCTYHLGKDVDDITTYRIGTIKKYTKTSAGPSKYKLWADLKLLLLVIRHYRTQRPVALHAHLHEGILVAIVVKILFFWRRTPLVADLQGSLVGELETYGSFEKYPWARAPLALIERTLLFFSNRIVCSSKHALDIMQERFPESAAKTSLAQDGADEPAEREPAAMDELRRTLDLPEDQTCVVYSGALLDSKGLDELKQIILQTAQASSAIHFLIIGYPTGNLLPFLKQHNLESRCTLTGQVDFAQLNDYLALGDIAIDPKNAEAGEGSGKTLNYMANAMSIVAFDTTNNRKFLGDQTKLATDIQSASDLILELSENPSLRGKTAQQAGERFKSLFSWDVCKVQLHDVYSDLFPHLSRLHN